MVRLGEIVGFVLFILLFIAADLEAQTFQVPVPASTVPANVVCPGGVPATQSGNTITCPGGVIPQCPSPPGPGPCGGPITCPAPNPALPSKTILLVEDWANPVRLMSGDFQLNDVVVVQFTTGSLPSGANLLRMSGAEWQGPPTRRYAAMSATACDFVGLPFGGATVSNSSSVTVPFTVANPNNYGYYPILKTNTTYYFNVKNAADSGCTGSCSMAFDLSKYGNP